MNTDIYFEEMRGKQGDIGIITLNRPQALNALNLDMIHALYARLQAWATTSTIKAVIVRAVEGRAFCAGGDIRAVYEKIQAQQPATQFFYDEYQLNRLIFHFPKPYIALLNGITMGGGVGISLHGSHRVATDNLLFAMPETGIGFFPDVGGTYFLPRLSNKFGFYLGLTGTRLAADDCIALGIAQYKVSPTIFPELIHALAETVFENDARKSVTTIIRSFALSTQPFSFSQQQQVIEQCFSADTMERILQGLQQSHERLCQEAALILAKKSPMSLKITLHALQLGSRLDFDACMQQEYRLVSRFVTSHDFAEGIRAVVIDKDQSPHWRPDSLSKITTEAVDKYFAPLTKELV